MFVEEVDLVVVLPVDVVEDVEDKVVVVGDEAKVDEIVRSVVVVGTVVVLVIFETVVGEKDETVKVVAAVVVSIEVE